jgi:hypothetical protein
MRGHKMKKFNLVLMVVMSIVMTGCYMETSEYYEHCDSSGYCYWLPVTQTPPTEVVYVYDKPSTSSHGHSHDGGDTTVYVDDSHNHTEIIIVEDNGYDPYYYEFTNNFQEFCYAEATPYHTTTCWVEYCYDHWLESGWYVWDEWCE